MSTLVNMDKKYFVLHVTNMGIKKNFAIFTQLRKMSKKNMPYSYLISCGGWTIALLFIFIVLSSSGFISLCVLSSGSM
jgi:GH18 family chitinase